MPNYIDKLDPRANEDLRNAVNYLLHNFIVSSAGALFVATINLAIQTGVSLGIDEMSAALKSGDPDYDKPPH